MLSIFLIGLALSIDAFTVCLGLGTNNISNRKSIILVVIIGIMHFIMTMLGYFFSTLFINILNFKILISIILYYLAIVMFFNKNKSNVDIYSFINIFLISFSVSLDSFMIGIGLIGITNHVILSSLVFAICSFSISYSGIILGKYSINFLKEKAKYFGIILLIIVATVNLCKFFLL